MTTQTPFHRMHFNSIQTLRGIAAVFVVLEHIRFLNCGAFGVDIFFCISGFMIMFTTYSNTEHFFLKRILRIVPFYYGMTLGSYFMMVIFPGMFEQDTARISYLVKSLLFIPFDIGSGVLQPLMRIGWTVNCEMFFYLLFGISLRISHRYRGVICSMLLCLLVILESILPSDWAPLIFYGNPVMLEFALGILCYYAVRGLYHLHAAGRLPHFISLAGCFFAVVLFAFLLISKPHVNVLGFRRLLYWGLPALLIVLAFWTAGLYLRMPSWSVKLGNISFSLYLVHYYPILFIDRNICDFSTLSPTSIAGAITSTILVILAAYLAWYLVEQKLTGWLRNQLLSI